MARFFNLGVAFARGVPRTAEIESSALDWIAPDWLRYTPTNWLLYSEKNAQQLSDLLHPYFPTDHFLVLPVDVSLGVQGWMSQFVWDWINRPRNAGWTPPLPAPRAVVPRNLFGGALGLGALSTPPPPGLFPPLDHKKKDP